MDQFDSVIDKFLSDDFAAEGLIHLYGKTEDLTQCIQVSIVVW